LFPHPAVSEDSFHDNKQNMEFLIENLKPKFENGIIKLFETSDEEYISKLNPELVWTDMILDCSCITNGFSPASQDDRISGYYVCEVPFKQEPFSQFIYTEIRIECEKCEGRGDVNGKECKKCEGEGFNYRYLNEIWEGL